MSKAVLDASAVLAYALGEPGTDAVRERLSNAAMSAVNYSEVLKKTIECGGDANVIALLLERASVEIVSFDASHAAEAADLYLATRDRGLSFADRACLALAIKLKSVVYTGDRRLAEVSGPVRVVLIRKEGGTMPRKK